MGIIKRNKKIFKLKGVLMNIGKLIRIDREFLELPDIFKQMITIETDDNQILFAEVRNTRLFILQGVEEKDYVEIGYTFQGSEKNGKKYNNIYVHNIKVL